MYPYASDGHVRAGGQSVPLASATADGPVVAADTMTYGDLDKKYAAAVSSAVANATGVRVRDFPTTLDKLIPHMPRMAWARLKEQ